MENKVIPTQKENPEGLHTRYYILKIDSNGELKMPEDDAEYFVLRLDNGCSDLKHLEACRYAILSYAFLIKDYLLKLSEDIIKRYG